MTQEAIIKNINLWAEKNLLDAEGTCFSLCVLDGAMDIIGKSDWWGEALEAISKWDGTPEKLDAKIKLSNSIDKNPIPLEKLFERVASYIRFHHTALPELGLNNLSQDMFLQPQSNFEILIDNEVRHIEDRQTIGGYFNHEQLTKLITEDNISKNICIIHTGYHAIRIGYNASQNKWILYNPNNSHSPPSARYIKFDSKNNLIEAITKKYGHSLGIEIATLDKNKKIPSLSSLYESNNSVNFLKENGLFFIAMYWPAILNKILDKTDEDKNFKDNFLSLLAKPIFTHWTGFSAIARYSPQYISQILPLIADDKKYYSYFAEALSKKNNGWTLLHIIAANSPEDINSIISLAQKDKHLRKYFFKAIATPNEQGLTGLHLIAMYAPETLPAIFDLAKGNKGFHKKLQLALFSKDNKGNNSFSYIKKYTEECLQSEAFKSFDHTFHPKIEILKQTTQTYSNYLRQTILRDLEKYNVELAKNAMLTIPIFEKNIRADISAIDLLATQYALSQMSEADREIQRVKNPDALVQMALYTFDEQSNILKKQTITHEEEKRLTYLSSLKKLPIEVVIGLQKYQAATKLSATLNTVDQTNSQKLTSFENLFSEKFATLTQRRDSATTTFLKVVASVGLALTGVGAVFIPKIWSVKGGQFAKEVGTIFNQQKSGSDKKNLPKKHESFTKKI